MKTTAEEARAVFDVLAAMTEVIRTKGEILRESCTLG